MRTPGFVGYFEKPLQDAMAAGTMVTSEVELFFDFCPCEIVAVTGSDGKTTTTTLIAKFFEAAGRKVHLGGNIGARCCPLLPEVSPDDVAVVELSSFQLISMHSSPNVAVVTNVTSNHLDHHKDMQEYIDAKRNILLYQTPPCRAVLGYENEISRSMQKDCFTAAIRIFLGQYEGEGGFDFSNTKRLLRDIPQSMYDHAVLEMKRMYSSFQYDLNKSELL